jgi:hypothetical protein
MIRSLTVQVRTPEPSRVDERLAGSIVRRALPRGRLAAVLAPLAFAMASVLTGCAADGDTSSIATTSEALQNVMGCQMAASQCNFMAKTPTEALACDAQLHACLAGLLPDGGASQSTSLWPFDAGRKLLCDDAGLPTPAFDAGLPPELGLDAALASSLAPDAALALPAIADAGLPTPPTPALDAGSAPGTGSPQNAAPADGGAMTLFGCLDTLGQCLSSRTLPMDCADQACTCLKSAIASALPRL